MRTFTTACALFLTFCCSLSLAAPPKPPGEAPPELPGAPPPKAGKTADAKVDRVEAAFDAGNEAFGKKNWTVANDRFSEVLAIQPGNEAALFNRAMARMELKQLDAAITDLQAYTKIKPQDADAYAELGWCYRAKGDDSNAIANFDKATAIDPNYNTLSGYSRGTVLATWIYIGVGAVILFFIGLVGWDLMRRMRQSQ